MADKFPLILNTSANQIQEIASGDNLDLTGCGINNAGVITATSFSGNGAGLIGVASTDYILTGTAATFTGGVDINSDLDVDGHTNLDNVSVAGVTTFAGNINANGNIVGDNSTNITGIAGVTATTLSGTLQTAAQTNITSVGTLSALTVSGNVNANGNIVGDNSTNITGIAGVTATTLAGTLQTAAQTNITSVGTLSSLNVSGNVSVGGTLTYEDVTNVDAVGLITARSGINIQGSSTFTGNVLDFAEGKQLRFGTGNDFAILHNGNTLLENETTGGNLTLNNKSTSGKIYLNVSDGDNALVATPDGSVEIHYANAKKIETTNTGAVITGICTATSFSGDGSALTGISAGPGTGESYVKFKNGATLNATGSNTMAGSEAGLSLNASSLENTLYGYRAGKAITAGKRNTAIGLEALESAAGDDNVAIGKNALQANTASTNTAVGNQAGKANSSGHSNVFVGYQAGVKVNTGNQCVYIGRNVAGEATSATECVAIGNYALTTNVSGTKNTAVGVAALRTATGTNNTALGSEGGYSVTSGNFNVCLGFSAGMASGGGGNSLTSGSNNIIIGKNSVPSAASVSNEITLGNSDITKFRIPGIGLELTGPVGLTTEQVTPSSNVATLNLAKDDHKIVASGTYTVNVNGGTEAGSHTLRIENSGTANVGFSTYFKFPSGGTPSLPTASGAISLISFTVHKVGSVGIATVLLAGASVNYS